LAEAARLAHRIAVLDKQGKGVLGSLSLPDAPGHRSEARIFNFVETVPVTRWASAGVVDPQTRCRCA
jgi:hypothetical protein